MNRMRELVNRSRGEHGITGLETAIVLIAFVVVAAVFASPRLDGGGTPVGGGGNTYARRPSRATTGPSWGALRAGELRATAAASIYLQAVGRVRA